MEDSVCGMLIKQINSELEKNANNMLRNDGLTVSQISVLMELDESIEKQMELKELEEVLHIAKPTVVGIVKRLEDKGFVISTRSIQDKRIRIIQLTPLGEKCCRRAKERMQQAEMTLTSSLTETERRILITLLQKVRDSF